MKKDDIYSSAGTKFESSTTADNLQVSQPNAKHNVSGSAGKENEFEWRQFCRLGEMIGDGLHYEPDGKWISKEYKRLAELLIPEIKEQNKKRRKLKSISVDAQMKSLLEKRTCSCGGTLKQSKSGAKVAYCQTCNARYVAKAK